MSHPPGAAARPAARAARAEQQLLHGRRAVRELCARFGKLYKMRAHLHHFTQYMDAAHFDVAHDLLSQAAAAALASSGASPAATPASSLAPAPVARARDTTLAFPKIHSRRLQPGHPRGAGSAGSREPSRRRNQLLGPASNEAATA